MKKSWTEGPARWRNQRHAQKSLRLRLQWRRWKREQRQGIRSLQASPRSHTKPPLTLTAPEVLSLLEDPDSSIRFFHQMQNFSKRRDLFVDLSNVSRITPDAIATLLALVRYLGDTERIRVSGNYPVDPVATNTIRESGFDQYLRTSLSPAATMRGTIIKRDLLMSSRRAEAHRAKQLVDFAAKHDGNPLRLKASYGHLLECMSNTHEHADEQPGQQPWWASVFQDVRRGCDCFTFIDMGVGIFNSIEFSMRVKLFNLIGNSHPATFHDLLLGKIPSSTRKSYRGRGLPGMYGSSQQGKITRLTIVTNDVFADVAGNRYSAMPEELKGVLLYWEVPYERSGKNHQS